MSSHRFFAVASFALFASAAHAGDPIGLPKYPGPGAPICDPALDPNCGRLIITAPGDGHIHPDPTFTATVANWLGFWDPASLQDAPMAFAAVDRELRDVSVYFMVGLDQENMYYRAVLSHADLGGRMDLGVTAADLDGDGNLDLVVGEPHNSRMAEDAGALHVFYGPLTEGRFDIERPDATIFGTVAGGEVGLGVGRVAGEISDGLRINGGHEGTMYVISPDSERLPEVLTERDLVKQ